MDGSAEPGPLEDEEEVGLWLCAEGAAKLKLALATGGTAADMAVPPPPPAF